MVVMSIIPATYTEIGGSWSNAGQKYKTYLKNRVKTKKAGGVAEVVEHLSSKHKA
jgi:hypothetical protein